MEAAIYGKADIVSLLLAAGADIEAKNSVSKRINTEIYNNSSEIEKRDFSRIFIFIQASNNTSKQIIMIKTINKNITHTNQIIISYISQL